MANKLGAIKILKPSSNTATGTLIFLHGSGDTGQGVRSWIKLLLGKDFVFPHLRVIFPTAPLMPYTPQDGEPSNVWFDREEISPDAPENMDSIDSMADQLSELIESEVASGISKNRIIVGGFSMGGAMAMHLGYRHQPNVAGVFALSSFLNKNSAVLEHLKSHPDMRRPPFFMCHGDRDTLVPLDWGEHAFKKLEELGVDGQFHTLRKTFHELKENELLKLYDWINDHLPEKSK